MNPSAETPFPSVAAWPSPGHTADTGEAKAVFLSYASQDAAAALHIVEALRAGGVEVWFDQAELVGGDAWDAKIRAQIATCTLFVPVISAATQARLEGYFRLEWKLAAQRTHTMAEAKPFLLPVVIRRHPRRRRACAAGVQGRAVDPPARRRSNVGVS
jgi:hypothetical protein